MLWSIVVGAAWAKTVVVCDPDAPSDPTVVCEAFSIKEALEASATEIVLAPGEHLAEGVQVDTEGLILRSLDPVERARITTTLPVPALLEIRADAVELLDVDLDGDTQARGLRVLGSRDVLLDNVVFENGVAALGGGGALRLAQTSSVRGFSVVFQNNGTGLSGVGGHIDVDETSELFLEGCTLSTGGADRGGAIAVRDNSRAELDRCSLVDNVATSKGGHIVVVTDSSLVLRSTLLTAGATDGAGAGVYAANAQDIDLSYAIVVGQANLVPGTDLYVSGASRVNILGSVFEPDTSVVGQTSIVLDNVQEVTLTGNVHEGTLGTSGGALAAYGVPSLVQIGSWFCDNSALDGAAVYLQDGCEVGCGIYSSVFQGGLATREGGAVYVSSAGSVAVDQNTFIDNTAVDGGGAVSLRAEQGAFRQNLLIRNLAQKAGALQLAEPLAAFDHNGWFDNGESDVAGASGPLPRGMRDRVLDDLPVLVDSPRLPRPCGEEPALVDWASDANEWLLAESVGAFTIDTDGDGVPLGFDCAPDDPDVSPDKEEIVGDGVDQDCDGLELCYQDLDMDGIGGSSTVETTSLGCEGPRQSPVSGDCDDEDPGRAPGAEEKPYDGVDQDCDGEDLVDVDEDGTPYPEDCNDLDPDAIFCDWFVGGGGCTTAPGGLPWGLGIAALLVTARRRRREARA